MICTYDMYVSQHCVFTLALPSGFYQPYDISFTRHYLYISLLKAIMCLQDRKWAERSLLECKMSKTPIAFRSTAAFPK